MSRLGLGLSFRRQFDCAPSLKVHTYELYLIPSIMCVSVSVAGTRVLKQTLNCIVITLESGALQFRGRYTRT